MQQYRRELSIYMVIEVVILSSLFSWCIFPDSKVHGANMGPIWDGQDPDGPHVGPMNFAIWVPRLNASLNELK